MVIITIIIIIIKDNGKQFNWFVNKRRGATDVSLNKSKWRRLFFVVVSCFLFPSSSTADLIPIKFDGGFFTALPPLLAAATTTATTTKRATYQAKQKKRKMSNLFLVSNATGRCRCRRRRRRRRRRHWPPLPPPPPPPSGRDK